MLDSGLESIYQELDSIKQFLLEEKKPFLSLEKASEYLEIPKNTLYQYTSKNILPYYKVGKRVYFKTEELDEFILNDKNRYASIEELNREKFKPYL